MELFVQQICNGLALGSLYALFGLGFGLVFSTLGILNLAHGTFATWGALICIWLMVHINVPLLVAVPLALLGAGLVGVLVDELGFQPLRRRSELVIPSIITSIGALIVLEGVARIVSDAQVVRVPSNAVPNGRLGWGWLRVSWPQAGSILSLVVVSVLLYFLLNRTRFGLALRAVGRDRGAASLAGVNARIVTLTTALLAGAAAGLAGILMGLSTNNVTFMLGDGLLLKGFAAVVVGGAGDVRGTVIAGLFLGVAEVLTGQYGSASYQDIVSFGLLIVFLVFRPGGIFKSDVTAERA